MYFSLFVSKRLVLVTTLIVVAIQVLFIRNVSSINTTNSYLQHKCYVNQGKYKPGSVYEKNLKSIIHSINSTGNFRGGYDMMSFSDGPDFVSFILQCRGDSYGPKCRSCYTTALSKLSSKCPQYKGGIIWYDQCFLEISGVNKEGRIDYENNFCMSNPKNVTNNRVDREKSFYLTWNSLIDNLTGIAIGEKQSKAPFYAAGERSLGTKKLYGMVQCTKDISIKGCQECMGFMIVHFQDCYYDKQGGRVLGRSCSYRFELYPFVTKAGPRYLKG